MERIDPFLHLARAMTSLGMDLVRFLSASLRTRTALAAENLVLRKQVALYRERQVKARRASASLRLTLVLLARCCAWPKPSPSSSQPRWGAGTAKPSGSSGARDPAGPGSRRSSSS